MRKLTTLASDQRGAAIMEFGLIAPILMVLMMGAVDATHRLYARSVLQGAVQKASRDAGLEGGTLQEQQDAIDEQVLAQVAPVNYGAEFTFERKAYRSFSRAAKPAEPFDDVNKDKACNNGEPFEDINNNGTRDLDIGVNGQGGAQDAVIYSVRMQYEAVTPVAGLFGLDPEVDLIARTVLRNQPYNDQGSDAAPSIRNCA